MDRKTVYDKILGSMVCCALGDAMGAVTENLSFDQIRDKYPGGVRELIAPMAIRRDRLPMISPRPIF